MQTGHGPYYNVGFVTSQNEESKKGERGIHYQMKHNTEREEVPCSLFMTNPGYVSPRMLAKNPFHILVATARVEPAFLKRQVHGVKKPVVQFDSISARF